MTIGQKIIFSSTLVALLAALAAFMGWKNTQPIQKELVQKLTHTTEEIHFLSDIKNNITEVQEKLLETVRTLNNGEITNTERFLKKGKLLDIRIKTLIVQIKSFEEFNKTPNTKSALKNILDLSESLRIQATILFPKTNTLPEESIVIKAGISTRKIVEDLKVIIKDINNQRFALIEKEGEQVQAQISKLNFWIILIGTLTFLMSILFGQIIARNLSSEFSKLREAATKLNKGDYSARVGLKSNDEFGKLGQTFDGMAANLQQSEIIEQQKLEMERLNEHLKVKNDSLDRFVYRVSHDLKAPVVNIISLLKLIKLKVGNLDNKEVQQSFFFLEKSSIKLQQTISDLLEVSRIERSLNSNRHWIDIEQIISDIKKENSEKISTSEVTITSDFKISKIYFCPKDLDSVLSNLITNGIKYCSTHRVPQIHLATERIDDFVCLRIKDNGIGIDLEKHQAKLFGMFNRFHNHVEGSGVGLYIVKKIIDESGGRVEVESEVGKGTTFSLFINQKDAATKVEKKTEQESFASSH